MKSLFYFLLGFLAILVFSTAYAKDPHHEHNVTTYQEVITNPIHNGTALALASNHNFYWGTNDYQWSVGAGFYEGNEGLSFGIGKRIDRVLFTSSIGIENGSTGARIGLSGQF